MSKFADLAKAVQDLLEKPFKFENKVELKTKASNGTTFASDVKLAEGKAPEANVTLTAKEGNVSIDKLTVGTTKKITGEFTLSGAVPNTDFTLKVTDGSKSADADVTTNVGATYKVPDYGVVTVDADVLTGPVFGFSGLFKYTGFLLGGSAKVGTSLVSEDKKVKAGQFADVAVAAGYQTDDFTFFVQNASSSVKAEKDGVTVALTHKASSTLDAGFQAVLPKDKTKPFGITFGGAYKVDADTTVTAIADNTAKVAVAYKQKLNPLATVTVSAQVDLPNLGSDDHKFGLVLNLTN